MAKLQDIQVMRLSDDSPDASWLEQEGFEDRLAEYQADGFGFIGIVVKANIETQHVERCCLLQTLQSGGLWGIESDSSEDYIQEVIAEKCDELKRVLDELGVEHKPEQWENLA